MYINESTLEYPLSEREIRALFPNTSFVEPFNPDGFAVVFTTPQPEFNQYTQVCREIVPAVTVKGTWEQRWVIVDLIEDELEAGLQRQQDDLTAASIQTMLNLTKSLEDYYDSIARIKQYDSRLTCALRAGYAGPFQTEGTEFAIWMDTCNAYGYQVMADVQVGLRAIPTGDELIAELPTSPWFN